MKQLTAAKGGPTGPIVTPVSQKQSFVFDTATNTLAPKPATPIATPIAAPTAAPTAAATPVQTQVVAA